MFLASQLFAYDFGLVKEMARLSEVGEKNIVQWTPLQQPDESRLQSRDVLQRRKLRGFDHRSAHATHRMHLVPRLGLDF
ncbi:hypothetical protein ANCCAN_06310 [Ancylostoma caninum]|uniref:Uncharacterized protein n=1 Tax=Ancylostoma caninum TaxID=29170 RepID=A0A368GTK2_ANCCA|nr:hypothetical protein ANCCAN_06310 [Ancylostoma caninum]